MKQIPEEILIKYYQEGTTIDELWEKYGIEVSMIRKILAENDIHIRENDK
jgi:uncharacterized protein (DUF433 family)